MKPSFSHTHTQVTNAMLLSPSFKIELFFVNDYEEIWYFSLFCVKQCYSSTSPPTDPILFKSEGFVI